MRDRSSTERDERHEARAGEEAPAEYQVLALQRSAGNAAVARALFNWRRKKAPAPAPQNWSARPTPGGAAQPGFVTAAHRARGGGRALSDGVAAGGHRGERGSGGASPAVTGPEEEHLYGTTVDATDVEAEAGLLYGNSPAEAPVPLGYSDPTAQESAPSDGYVEVEGAPGAAPSDGYVEVEADAEQAPESLGYSYASPEDRPLVLEVLHEQLDAPASVIEAVADEIQAGELSMLGGEEGHQYGKTPGDTPEYGKTPADTPSGQAPAPERPTSPWASAQPSAWDRGRSGAPRRRLRKDQKRERLAKYANEKLDSQFMVDHYAIAPAEQAVQNGESPSVREYLKANSGWSDDDVTRYYERREAGKVDYVDHERRRDELELHPASAFTQGPEGEVFDTSAMYSKFKGPGFGIYVMSPGGRFYADQHRVGLFHHTTFLEGGDVAGAGEICTDASGRLKHITNKSGHYIPTDDSMFYVLEELVARGVSLRGVGLTLLSRGPDDYPGGAQAFFEQHKAKVPGP